MALTILDPTNEAVPLERKITPRPEVIKGKEMEKRVRELELAEARRLAEEAQASQNSGNPLPPETSTGGEQGSESRPSDPYQPPSW